MIASVRSILGITVLGLSSLTGVAQKDVPVPQSCTPQVNRALQQLIRDNPRRNVDNILVCGVASAKSRVQRGGRHGSHHVIPLTVELPEDGRVQIQVVVNDDLVGPVTARRDDPVFAYGQGYIAHGPWAAGIHDVHCSTHRGADNGWVVVDGQKRPDSCPTRY